MTYNVAWASLGAQGIIGKATIALADLSTDSSTSLILTGKGVPNYGQIQQQNFIRLLENFASVIAPTNPTVGQLWYNPTDVALYACVDVSATAGQTVHYPSGGKAWLNIGNMGTTGAAGGGADVVTTASITAALGYTPYDGNSNPLNFISVLSATAIDTALGYTPYDGNTNPKGFLTFATYPAAPVQSVAGRTGNVLISQADVSGLTTVSSPTFAAVSVHGGYAPAVNPTSPADGDIKVVGSVVSIYAAGVWQQIFPAVYS